MPTTRRNPWVALDAAADPVDLSRRLQHAHSTVVEHDGRVPAEVRPVVLESWRRTSRAGLRPDDNRAPVVITESDVDELRRAHPLAIALPAIHQAVGRIAQDAGHLLVVTDATGTLLWAEGHSGIKGAAAALGFFEGARWSEGAVGTNAIGTALAIDHPVQILSGEHFVRTHHPWVCSGAPIHDPETGAQLGVIDLSGPLRTAHPMILGFVTTAARMAEHLLAERMHRRDRVLHEALLSALERHGRGRCAVVSPSGRVVASWPHGWLTGRIAPPVGEGPLVLPDGTPAEASAVGDAGFLLNRSGTATSAGDDGHARVARATSPDAATPSVEPGSQRTAGGPQAVTDLRLLSGVPTVAWAGREHELRLRHAEILCLLAVAPAGLTAAELALGLYGPGANPVTVRAELSRLRRLLGPRLLTRPYRLVPSVDVDLVRVRSALAAGRGAEALHRAPGTLLARSVAPGVVTLRAELEEALDRARFSVSDTAGAPGPAPSSDAT